MPGVRVSGAALPKSGSIENFLKKKAQLWGDESLTIEAGYHVWHPTRAELGGVLSVTDMLNTIHQLGRSASPFVALGAWWQGALGPGHDLRWRGKLESEEKLEQYTQRLREEVDRLPIPGSYDPEGNPINGLAGEALDAEAVKRAIRSALARSASKLHVATIVTPAPRSHRR